MLKLDLECEDVDDTFKEEFDERSDDEHLRRGRKSIVRIEAVTEIETEACGGKGGGAGRVSHFRNSTKMRRSRKTMKRRGQGKLKKPRKSISLPSKSDQLTVSSECHVPSGAVCALPFCESMR